MEWRRNSAKLGLQGEHGILDSSKIVVNHLLFDSIIRKNTSFWVFYVFLKECNPDELFEHGVSRIGKRRDLLLLIGCSDHFLRERISYVTNSFI